MKIKTKFSDFFIKISNKKKNALIQCVLRHSQIKETSNNFSKIFSNLNFLTKAKDGK